MCVLLLQVLLLLAWEGAPGYFLSTLNFFLLLADQEPALGSN